jgi:hypothetical protein
MKKEYDYENMLTVYKLGRNDGSFKDFEEMIQKIKTENKK